MKKLFGVLSIVLVIMIPLDAQIVPNGSFEEWEWRENRLRPVGWVTNQDTFYRRFERSELSTTGNYSLKFVTGEVNSAFQDCSSLAYTFFKVEELGENAELKFNIRIKQEIDPYNRGSYFWLRCHLLLNQELIETVDWIHRDSISDFTEISLPFSETEADTIAIFLLGSARGGDLDGCVDRSTAWVDDLRIASTVNISEQIAMEYQVFPNPASTELRINVSQEPEVVWIKNLNGEVVKELRNSSVIEVGEFPPAMYLIEWELRNGKRFIEKWVKI
ncbi:MAG TPA: T9SS type A sorting domain-containing protein [Saprospiraceae bacterium]|nr:T9SS type A sorting domain-containing protein [Saprospiraceae bacterium]